MTRPLSGLPIGRMVADQASHAPPMRAPGTCAVCGCKLSRYREMPMIDPQTGKPRAELCAPCDAADKRDTGQLTVTFPGNERRYCACGARLHRDNKGGLCRPCYEAQARTRSPHKCADCGKPMWKRAKTGLCFACYTWTKRHTALATAPKCADCGKPIHPDATRCFPCAMRARRHPDRTCPSCGGNKGRKESQFCRKCRDARGGSKNAARTAA